MQNMVANGDFGVKSASRKGFYDWDEAAIEREQARYQTALRKAMQILQDEDDAARAGQV
jgi:3-hydroxybutyryl-CoA dehydrogenase